MGGRLVLGSWAAGWLLGGGIRRAAPVWPSSTIMLVATVLQLGMIVLLLVVLRCGRRHRDLAVHRMKQWLSDRSKQDQFRWEEVSSRMSSAMHGLKGDLAEAVEAQAERCAAAASKLEELAREVRRVADLTRGSGTGDESGGPGLRGDGGCQS